jgi:HD-GYP domain-containing protein (c-di-GMP phosphodiesterase class II)
MLRLASQIAAAVTMRALYPSNHPRVRTAVEDLMESVRRLEPDAPSRSLTFLVVGDDLVIEDEVIRQSTLAVHAFVGVMKRHGIERLTIGEGIGLDETHALIEGLSAGGEKLQPSAHVIFGRAQVVIENQAEPAGPRTEVTARQLEIVGEAWARFRVERRLPIDQLEVLVWSFIDSMSGTTREMLPLAKVKAHDEYTFVHSVNVALLVLAQARSFGIWGPMLHAFGMAGLLHDIGKLTVPVELLNKAGVLNDKEWEIMKAHASGGAWMLAEMEGTPALAVIVAFEHHLRFDHRPNYPPVRKPRLPALASRMTAIADTFDAVSTVRPHQQAFSRSAAFDVLRKRAGTYYDPELVRNFVRLMTEAAP